MSNDFRKALYGVIGAIGVLFVTLHVVPVGFDTTWLPVADGILGIIATVIAAVKAKRWDFKAIYLAVAAVLTALATTGVVDPSLLTSIDGLLFQLSILGSFLGFVRTDTATPTGEPLSEYNQGS